MQNQTMPGIPAGGLKEVGQIHPTNDLVLQRTQNAMDIAVALLSSHTQGAPVVDDKKHLVGFVSESDLLRALRADKDLNSLTAEDVMVRGHIAVTADTNIDDALKLMEDKRLLDLPVTKEGTVAYSITRHDMLRAWIGLGVDIET